MNLFQKSDALYLLAFFSFIILIGTGLFMLPLSWKEPPPSQALVIDALFTATSAVCVTGLSTVDVTALSGFGLLVLGLLIQIGGLGIISFTSILITIPGHRFALSRRSTIRSFYLEGVEYNPRRIVRKITALTLGIEAAGAALLAMFFRAAGTEHWAAMGAFHAVSAFCNAGFSPIPGGLGDFAAHIPFQGIIMALIILGGLGFIVISDIYEVLKSRKRALSYHSRVVLVMTAALILGGALCFFLLEHSRLYGNLSAGGALLNSLFQAVTPRTAGFEILPQTGLSQPSKLLTCLLMFIGGAPGSIAGGIKVTTVFVIAALMFRKPDLQGDIKLYRRRLNAETLNKAVTYFLKAAGLALLFIALLSLTEHRGGVSGGRIVFEVFSALGTVGLTLNLTPSLSLAGKIVIIAAMFAGRVGLVALAFPVLKGKTYNINYPEGSILLG